MITPYARQIIAVGLFVPLSLLIAAFSYVQGGNSYTIAQPKAKLDSIPTQLGAWSGEVTGLSEQEYDVLDADDVVGLSLRGPGGVRAYAHMATWTDKKLVGMVCPHHPSLCYQNTGWKTVRTQPDSVDVPGIGTVPVTIAEMQRDGVHVVIAHTYEIGPHYLVNDGGIRSVKMKLFGQDEWPPVTKYLIQVNSLTLAEGSIAAKQILAELLTWHANQETLPSADVR